MASYKRLLLLVLVAAVALSSVRCVSDKKTADIEEEDFEDDYEDTEDVDAHKLHPHAHLHAHHHHAPKHEGKHEEHHHHHSAPPPPPIPVPLIVPIVEAAREYEQKPAYAEPVTSYGNQQSYEQQQQPAYNQAQQSYAPQSNYSQQQQSYAAPSYEHQAAPQAAYAPARQNYTQAQPPVAQLTYGPQQEHAYAQPAQQAYSQPQQASYEQAAPVYAPQQPTYQAPQQNYTQPQQSYAPQQPTYQAPQQNYTQPQQSYAQQPQQSYAQPQQPSYEPQTAPPPPPPLAYAPQQSAPYQPPAAPQQNYTQPQSYAQAAPPPAQQPTYAHYTEQTYSQPQPQQPYQAAQSYASTNNYTQAQLPAPVYQAATAPVSYPPPASYAPAAPVVAAPIVAEYKAPVAQVAYAPASPAYQQPSLPAPQQTYSAPPPPTYQAAPVSNYSVPPPPPPPQYKPVPLPPSYNKPPQAPPYKQPAQQPQQPYKPPAHQQQQQPKQQTYKPVYKPQYPVQTQQPYQHNSLAAAQLAAKYSLADLAPFVSSTGYQSNHMQLFYYRGAAPFACTLSKNTKYSVPTARDIELAFSEALDKLGTFKTGNIKYMDMNNPSYSARHQIASYLSQGNARRDEEGLLVEIVSRSLADRLCLTKWDRQRYLPQLTKLIGANRFPATHSCSSYYKHNTPYKGPNSACVQSRYRQIDGFCNNPWHPYWGKANVCHIRLLQPDYADGISAPRDTHNLAYPLPNPRAISAYIHNDVPLDGPYNLMKMQWGQFINHDISNTALSAYDGLVDCCKHKSARGCWPIYVPAGDSFYGSLNVTCLNFIRSGVCPTCQLGPRQQFNKNTAFLDASHVYGNTVDQANKLRTFRDGLLKVSTTKNGDVLMPIASSQEQCTGICYEAGDSRSNQHPALTALHVLMLRNHNLIAQQLKLKHPNWNDETLYQEARRLSIAEYQMITYNEYFPIVFGPILSAYFKLLPLHTGHTQYDPKTDPTTWNEYVTAACRFGHSQIQGMFGLYNRLIGYGQPQDDKQTFPLKDWFFRPSLLQDGLLVPIVNGLLSRPSSVVDPWVSNHVRDHLYKSHTEKSGGDLPATNIWRGRDHGIPGYIYYLDYCFNAKVQGWKDLALFIPPLTLNRLRHMYKVVENIDLFTGGISERHFPGADIGPTFACINGIQYHHLKFGDRYYFEHANQVGSFNQAQLSDIKRATLARFLCRTAYLPAVPQYAFMQASPYNPIINCSQIGDFNYALY